MINDTTIKFAFKSLVQELETMMVSLIE